MKMKIPEGWCTEKRILLEHKKDWQKARRDGDLETADLIKIEWQKDAEQYRDYNRLLKIYKGGRQHSPRQDISEIFTLEENFPLIAKGGD